MRLHLDNWYENMRQATRRGTESRSWQRCWRSCRTNIGSGWGTCTKGSSTNVLNLAYLSYTQIRWTRQQLLSSPVTANPDNFCRPAPTSRPATRKTRPGSILVWPEMSQNTYWHLTRSGTGPRARHLRAEGGHRLASSGQKKGVNGKKYKKKGPIGPEITLFKMFLPYSILKDWHCPRWFRMRDNKSFDAFNFLF